MNKLSQELVDRISSFCSRDDLKNTLLVSRAFRVAAEHYSEAFRHFNLTENNAGKFLDIYNGQRFRHLRTVSFTTNVSSLEEEEGVYERCRDNEEDLDLIDQEFTRQINFLFSTLRALEWQLGDESDSRTKIHLKIFEPTRDINGAGCRDHRTHVSWRVHLLSPSKLPSLKSVQCLTLKRKHHSAYMRLQEPSVLKVDLRVLLDMASKLPNLETLRCRIGGDEWFAAQSVESANQVRHDWDGPRRDSRHDFAKQMRHISAVQLRHARLDFIFPIYESDGIDQRRAMPNLTSPGTYDPFSSSLRVLSYQLRSMHLRVVADETLFWPADSSTPSWPNLETVSVMFHMVSPNGTWYFKGRPGIGANEGYAVTERSYPPLATTAEDEAVDVDLMDYQWDANELCAQYRVEPNDDVIVPFLMAFAKAAAAMPSLKVAQLWAALTFDPGSITAYDDFDPRQVCKEGTYHLAWGLAYSRPGTEAVMLYPGKDFCAARQLWWKVGRWRPDFDLHRLFQQLGRNEHGDVLVEYWDDDDCEDLLVGRDVFEEFEGRAYSQ
jgi:hypothetical protein